MLPSLIDAHCHMEGIQGEALHAIVARARAAGVVHAVVVGQLQAPGDFGEALRAAEEGGGFFSPTMGIHPHEAIHADEENLSALEAICRQPRVVAVGEAGLDYHYDRSPRPAQRAAFARQCALAKTLGKPLVVHVREAHADCLEILREESVTSGVIHCFTGGVAEARGYLNQGFFLSLSGVLTYKKTEPLQEAVAFAPLDRLMVETDSPYLSPVPYRGKKNEPAYVVEVARKISELKGRPLEEVALETKQTTSRLFRLAREEP